MEPHRGSTEFDRDYARMGAEAVKMPRSGDAPVSNDVLGRLANMLNTVYESVDRMRPMIQRARIIDVNLMREPEDGNVKSATEVMEPSLPSLADDAIGRCQQVRDGLNILDAYHTELSGVLTRVEGKLFGEGPF